MRVRGTNAYQHDLSISNDHVRKPTAEERSHFSFDKKQGPH